MDRNNLIGVKNKLPWHLSADLRHFKQLTQGNIIVMGRQTYESLGKALPKRINIVLSKDKSFKPKDCLVFNSIGDLIPIIAAEEEAFIIGGSSVYEQFLPYVEKLYLTHIDSAFYGDSYFPQFNDSDFEIVSIKDGDKTDPYNYTFVEYKRKNT